LGSPKLLSGTYHDHRLTTALKERLQQFGAAACQNTTPNFYAMVQLRVTQHLHYRMNRARFGIVGSVDEALDPGMHQRARAHGARLNCSKQIAVSQAVVTNGCTGFAQGDNFRMRGGIGVRDVTVPSPADDFSVAHHHRAHGDFTCFQGALRSAEGFLHPKFVVVGRNVFSFFGPAKGYCSGRPLDPASQLHYIRA